MKAARRNCVLQAEEANIMVCMHNDRNVVLSRHTQIARERYIRIQVNTLNPTEIASEKVVRMIFTHAHMLSVVVPAVSNWSPDLSRTK